MDWTRLSQRRKDFDSALAQLQKAADQPLDEFIRDSVIQRFEFTYELAWKMLKLWLESKDIDVRNAKDTLREALQQGQIEDGNRWSELHRMRNLTSHTHDQQLAMQVYDFIVSEGLELLRQLQITSQTWQAG